MNVLSLFDGMSCGQIALNRLGVKSFRYYASEIEKAPMQITQKNYPHTIQLGDVTKIAVDKLPVIHLLLGGSPCQGFSFAGKQLNFNDPRSKLFFDYVRVLKKLRKKNPDIKFLLENVKMKKEFQDIISKELGVFPIEINSALVSAQNRRRLYWTNIEDVTQPKDKGILLKDIVLKDAIPVTYTERRTEEAKRIRRESLKNKKRDFSPRRGKELVPRQDNKSNCLTATFSNKEHLILTKKANVWPVVLHNIYGGFKEKSVRVFEGKSPTLKVNSGGGSIPYFIKKDFILSANAVKYMNRKVKGGRTHWDFKHHSEVSNDKSSSIVANFFKGVPYNVLKDSDCIRKFHPIECERLQTVPDNYTEGVSDSQRYKMLGNGWTVDVICHILKNIIWL